MLELQRVAVEVYRVVFLALRTGELVHHTAHHACILVLASLTDKRQLCAIFLVVRKCPTHLFGKGTRGDYFHRRTTTQPRAGRYVTEIEQVITALQLRFGVTARDDVDTAQGVVTPSAVSLRLNGVDSDLIGLRHVQRFEPQHFFCIRSD